MLCFSKWLRHDRALEHEDSMHHVNALRSRQSALGFLLNNSGPRASPRGTADSADVSRFLDCNSDTLTLEDPYPSSPPQEPLHGPALPSDPLDSIYDDFAGDFAAGMSERGQDLTDSTAAAWDDRCAPAGNLDGPEANNDGLDAAEVAKAAAREGGECWVPTHHTVCRLNVGHFPDLLESELDDPEGFWPYENQKVRHILLFINKIFV
jgi:hypothetical protein